MLLDVGMGPHHLIEFDRVAVLVAIEAPVAKVHGGEETVLGAGVPWFTAHNESSAIGPVRQIN